MFYATVRRAIARILIVMALVSAVLILTAPSAHAAGDAAPVFSFEPNWPMLLNLLIGVVFPLLVGVVSTRVTSGRRKAYLLATISLASGLVTQLLTAILAGAPFDVFAAVTGGVGSWLVAIATYEGFLKPTGIAGAVIDQVGRGANKRVDGAHNN